MTNNNTRKLKKNEVLKAMEIYDRYPYIPFWYIIKEISEKPGISEDNINYWFKYGYGHPEKKQIFRSYDPALEMQEIYKHMEKYIQREQNQFAHDTTLTRQKDFYSIYKYVWASTFDQAIQEREHWRGVTKFINNYIPKQIDTATQQESNINKARKFGRMAYKYVGDIIASNNMSSSDPSAIAMHGTIGGMIAKMCGKYNIQGEVLGEINKAIVAKIYANKKAIGFSDKDVINFSRRLGEYLGKSLGLGEQLGGEIAEMATRWNTYGGNVNFFGFNAEDILEAGVLNFDALLDSPAGHTTFYIRLRNNKQYSIGLGPQKGDSGIKALTALSKTQIEVKEIADSDFVNYSRPMTLHIYKNFNDENKKSIFNYLNNQLSKQHIKTYSSDSSQYTSTNNNYDPVFDNCVNFVYNGLNYSNMGKYAGFAKSNPYSSRDVLSKDENWSTKVFGNKLLQGQVAISDKVIQAANRKL